MYRTRRASESWSRHNGLTVVHVPSLERLCRHHGIDSALTAEHLHVRPDNDLEAGTATASERLLIQGNGKHRIRATDAHRTTAAGAVFPTGWLTRDTDGHRRSGCTSQNLCRPAGILCLINWSTETQETLFDFDMSQPLLVMPRT
jgi:hypothetical protein